MLRLPHICEHSYIRNVFVDTLHALINDVHLSLHEDPANSNAALPETNLVRLQDILDRATFESHILLCKEQCSHFIYTVWPKYPATYPKLWWTC